ncbi:MAG TPA: hypothetical protein VJ813_07785 [Vicinamibacterales bacterium]|nr:hypothetical protein [Vicinamibacterales bacterium]
MSLESTLLWTLIGAAGVVAGSYLLYGLWQAVGSWRIRRAGPRPLTSVEHVLWRDPGEVGRLDLADGPGGAAGRPAPPFRFLEEHLGGSQPCLSVIDGRGRRWRVKWGNEVNSETFAVRIAWACGYFAETTYFLAEGKIDGATGLQRALSCVDAQGRFESARFELDDASVKKLFEEHSWAWNDNPFLGSPELQGLKIVNMLLSNWDTKDRRDVARGSNTAIFEHATPHGREARYLITDWGGSMGSWGANIITRGRWNAAAFAAQTPQFVGSADDGVVRFGYIGQRTEDLASGITPRDVRWLCRYLRQISDDQLDAALQASGATGPEREQFRASLRNRINQLLGVSAPSASRARDPRATDASDISAAAPF